MRTIPPPDVPASAVRTSAPALVGGTVAAPAADRHVGGGPTPGVAVRADGSRLLGELPGSGYRRPPALVRRADGQTVQLTRLLYLVLEAVDGRRDHAEIAEVVGERMGRLVTADDVRLLIDSR